MLHRTRCQAAILTILLVLSIIFAACAKQEQAAAPSVLKPAEEPVITLPGNPEAPVTRPEELSTDDVTSPVWTDVHVETTPVETEPVVTEPAPIEPEPMPTEPEPVVTEPEPTFTDLTKNFSREEWKRINIFLSNFSEIGFTDYNGKSDDEEFDLLYFGFLHLKINDPSKVEYDDYYCGVSQANMDKCLNRFFGRTVPEGGYSRSYGGYSVNIHYWDGAFRFAAGEGEAYNYLSVVYQMQKTDHNTYLVWFDVFELDIEEYFDKGISDSYYSMTYSEAVSSSKLTYCYTGTAEVRDYESGSFKSYQLISYDVN